MMGIVAKFDEMARMAVFIVYKSQSKKGYPTILRRLFGVKGIERQI